MKKTAILGIVAVAAMISSCSVTMPLSVSAAPIGSKKGSSSTVVFCGIQFNKAFGISDAAKNGKITAGVATVDLKTTNYIFWVKKEIQVTGS